MAKNKVPEQPPFDPAAQAFQDEMLRVPPLAEIDAEAMSQGAVAIVLPAWLAGTEQSVQYRRGCGKLSWSDVDSRETLSVA